MNAVAKGFKKFSGFVRKSFMLSASQYRGGAGWWLFNQDGGHDVSFNYKAVNSSLIAYNDCAPLTAIINRKAQAYINGKNLIINTQGKAKGKESTSEIANKVRSLMSRPNPLQNWRHFDAQNYIYQQIRGYTVVLPIKSVGFPNSDAKYLWNIPPWLLNVIERPSVNMLSATSIKDFIESISIVWGGYTTPLNLDDVFIFKDYTPSSYSLALPESRTWALRQPIDNIIGTYSSWRSIIKQRGPRFLISSNKSDVSGNVPLKPDEKRDVESDFKMFGLMAEQSQAIITSANVNLQTVGFSTKDLMLIEAADDSVQRICDSYNYPYRLLSSSKSNSLGGSDIEAYKKLLYQDAIIPEAESISEQWMQFFDLEKYNLTFSKDYRHVGALQEDQVNEGRARLFRNQGLLLEFQNNLVTLNEWRDINGDDPLTNGLGDLYYFELLAKGIQFGQGNQGSSVPESQSTQNADNANPSNNQNNAN